MGSMWMYLIGALVVLGVAVLWRKMNAARRVAERRRAILEFDQRRNDLATRFLHAAAATGKPRGLRWTSVELAGRPLFAADAADRELVALIGATISFEAVEGGGMEDVEAVGNLRSATAVFVFRDGEWTTDGRVIFNLEPAEALERFQSALRPVAAVDD